MFKHNLQGLRIATKLASLYEGYEGLNLSNFTLWGIKNHTGTFWKRCEFLSHGEEDKRFCNIEPFIQGRQCSNLDKELKFYSKYNRHLMRSDNNTDAWSFEGYLVKESDEIAQRHHDAEDGLIAKLITKEEILTVIETTLGKFFNREESAFFNKTKSQKGNYFIQCISRIIVGSLNRNLIESSLQNLKRFAKFHNLKTRKDFCNAYMNIDVNFECNDDKGELNTSKIIAYPKELASAEKTLQSFLRDRVLNSYQVQRMDGKARFMLRQLVKAYLTNPQQLPDNCVRLFFLKLNNLEGNSIGDMRNWLSEKYYSHKKGDNHFLLRANCKTI